jgi:hypothetical protein
MLVSLLAQCQRQTQAFDIGFGGILVLARDTSFMRRLVPSDCNNTQQ